MKPSTVCLPETEIPLLLSGDLPPDEAAAAESHLAECETCRSVIESMIADARWWEDARHSLASYSTREAVHSRAAHDTEPTTNEQMLELLGPTDDPAMLGRIGAYEVVGILGRGGMGAVFKGYDGALNRFVAIKMLLPHLAASGAARKRFAREAQAAAAIVDDHVMAIHGVSEWKSVPYFVMPYARGVSLQKRLSKDGPLEVREVLRIGMQAARGLAAAHAQGLVHRDVKPANIFLDEGVERVQLMDFGLARAVDDASLTRSGTLAGTPQYMSPEQARAEAVDHRSDLFSLGSVLYAMCVGHAPFRAESSHSVLRLITDKEPRPIRELNPDIPDWLCAVISKLMSKQAENRFQSAEQVADLLETCLAHVQQPTTTPLPEPVAALAPKENRRPPIGRFMAAAAFAFSLIFAGVLIVLELNKGTLRIESEADDVPIRIMQGDEVVKKLTVTKGAESVRIAAGPYLVHIDGKFNGFEVNGDTVSLSRGGTETVRIVRSVETPESTDAPANEKGPGAADPHFHVIGLVQKPDIYAFPVGQEIRLLGAIAMAGGPTSEVADTVILRRPIPGQDDRTVIRLSLREARQSVEANLLLAPGDVLSLEPDPRSTWIQNEENSVDKNSDKLSAMKGWVIAWDEQTGQSHGDGKRRAILRVFLDGRVAAMYGANATLVQTRIDAQQVERLVEQLKQQGTKREIEKLFPVRNKFPLLADEHAAIQSSVGKTARELNIGDPLPHTLWDQTANRITVVHDGEWYDMMTIEPPHPERSNPAIQAGIADLPKETLRQLLELVYLANIGGNEALVECLSFANAELRYRNRNTPILLSMSNAHFIARAGDGVEAMFHFTAEPGRYSFPSGEILVGRAASGNWIVKRAQYWFDAETCERWGSLEEDVSEVVAPSAKAKGADAPKVDWLAALQGRWNIEIRGQEDGEPIRETATAFVRNNRLDLRRSDGKESTMYELTVGRIGPPQEIDLRVEDLITNEALAIQGIIETDHDSLCICYHGESGRPRPIQFSDTGGWVIWTFTRSGDQGNYAGAREGDGERDNSMLAEAVAQFNRQSAADRRTLFDPPIPDLTEEQLREGFQKAAQKHRKDGETDIAATLAKIAETGRMPEGVVGNVVASVFESKDEKGEIETRQIVPGLLVRRDDASYRLVLLQSLSLRFSKEGASSKRYGDTANSADNAKTLSQQNKEGNGVERLHNDDDRVSKAEENASQQAELRGTWRMATDSCEVRVDSRIGTLQVFKPISLKAAVSKFNEMAKTHEVGRGQPELTAEEIVGAFRLWVARKECNDATRKDFQQVIDSRTLRPGHIIQFSTQTETDGHLFTVWAIQFGDDDSYAWFRIRNVTLISRLKSEDERKAWEQAKDTMSQSFREARLSGQLHREAGTPTRDADINTETKLAPFEQSN